MNDTFYQLSLNILKALGGDVTIVYPDADAIWYEINKIYDNAGNRFDIVPLEKTITENGEYEYYPDGDVDAFMPVNLTVNIPQKYTDEQVFEIEANAIQQGYDNGYSEGETAGKLIGREEGYTDGFNTGYSDGVTDGGEAQKAKLVDITITENGTYTKDDGYKTVTVEIEAGIPEEELQQMLKEAMDEGYQDGYAEGVDDGKEDGIAEQKEKLTSTTFTENGTYTREDGWNSVTIKVAGTGGGDSGKPKIYNGFRFTGGQIKNIDFSQYDWSNVYDTTGFFVNCSYSLNDCDNFINNFNGRMLSCKNMFNRSNGPFIYDIPNFSKFTEGCISLSGTFESQPALKTADNIQYWKTNKVLDTSNMFKQCSALITIPLFDTSNVTNMSNMFNGCRALTSVPEFDTSNVTNMSYMFNDCSALTSVPEFDFSNVISIANFCKGCSKLAELPNINCKSLASFSSNWFPTTVQKIGIIDCDSVSNANYILSSSSNNVTLTDIGGFRNLGKVSALTNTNNNYVLYYFPNLTKESILNVLNLLYDRASTGYSVLTLKMHANHLAMLSDEEKAIATNKGWTLA